MTNLELYELWCQKATEDEDLIKELKSIKNDANAIKERFYADLEFGTAGLRGVIGAGTIRMNIYTVRRATQGLAEYLNEKYDNPSVAIAYDSRIKSDLFSKDVAAVLAANGIKVYLHEELEPTPVLSFTVRKLKTNAGIMITASHNPAKYNGYKCYGSDGCQMTMNDANAVLNKIKNVDMFDGVKIMSFDEGIKSGKIEFIGEEILEKFYEKINDTLINPQILKETDLKVIYTPLNGTGNKPVREMLKRAGVKNVFVVKEQELPDGNFPTAPFPNPEIRQCFELAIKMASTINPDILIATDPDCDRIGIAVNVNGEYVLMTGNEVGVMILNYILSQKKEKGIMPSSPVAFKTIVTTELTTEVAKHYNCAMIDLLTGFKFIGEQIGLLEAENKEDNYILGFEESYGYLSGTHVRDKDAVNAALVICDMAAFYKKQGKNLVEVMDEIYKKFGYYVNSGDEIICEGSAGMQKITNIMKSLRAEPLSSIADVKVTTISDYFTSKEKDIINNNINKITLPQSDVISYTLENGSKVIVRPSGTEPKIKIYYTTKGITKADAKDKITKLKAAMAELID